MSSGIQDSVIITGGCGFVGKHLVAELSSHAPAVHIIVWDLHPDTLPHAVEFVQCDITNSGTYEQSLRKAQPQWIVHLAGIAALDAARKNPELAHRINMDATVSLMQSVTSSSPATHVLVASSAEVYGEAFLQADKPLAELPLSQCQPVNPYAKSKYDMEVALEEQFLEISVRVRPFAHIGPGQGRGFVTADFASQIAEIEHGMREPVIRVGNLSAFRDFTDVRDVVCAYRLLLTEQSLGQVYNVASGQAVQIQQILDELLSMSSVPITVQEDPDRMRPSDIWRMAGDASKLTSQTGWTPHIPLRQSLRDILNWWREQGHMTNSPHV